MGSRHQGINEASIKENTYMHILYRLHTPRMSISRNWSQCTLVILGGS